MLQEVPVNPLEYFTSNWNVCYIKTLDKRPGMLLVKEVSFLLKTQRKIFTL